jgi:hypothetical protein
VAYFHLTDGKQVLSNHKGIDLSGNAAAREDALALARDLEHDVVMAGWNWTGWFVAIVDQLFYKKSVSRIFGRFPLPARSVAFFSARSHRSGSASFLVCSTVSDTPNSPCFRQKKAPGSISCASALQIGHVSIATTLW